MALAQALVHDPEVLVLDEPTEGLDPNQIVQIRELIRSLAGQHTIILSSHILSEVQNTCDHIIIIHKGKIVTQGTYAELLGSLKGASAYKLGVNQKADQLAVDLAGVAGVVNARVSRENSDLVEFDLARRDDGTLDKVIRKVLDGGYGFKELAPKSQSLEEVFFQLTK